MTDSRTQHRERTHDTRAGDACPTCGRPFDAVDRVDVHHHDGNATNGTPENLRKRCQRCHLQGEHDRHPEQSATPTPGHTGPSSPRSAGPR